MELADRNVPRKGLQQRLIDNNPSPLHCALFGLPPSYCSSAVFKMHTDRQAGRPAYAENIQKNKLRLISRHWGPSSSVLGRSDIRGEILLFHPSVQHLFGPDTASVLNCCFLESSIQPKIKTFCGTGPKFSRQQMKDSKWSPCLEQDLLALKATQKDFCFKRKKSAVI